MKTIATASNTNNSRATIEFHSGDILSAAANIATKNGCGFSHNCTIRPLSTHSFGTVSFNKGNHAAALAEFVQLCP